ncbi:hypothetical protein [Archangium lansingense]|uniref:Lipoprotein n=1 Tax=Archangium lansingense TaxID=2995310 RepID=A0ABT4A0C4_9BACT|nr:hypothetical protein [Archangium lansinium]MCY1075105.1 hypothetical protein [Archangium lansinium]
MPTEPEPVPTDTTPTPAHPYTLAAVPSEEMAEANPPQQSRAFRGVLTTGSQPCPPYFHCDAFVVTAQTSGLVKISSDVLQVNPDVYPNGYGYPLTIAPIEEGVTLTQYGGEYLQNALEDGTAVLQYPVQKERQYILVYKTFSSFMPLTHRLRLPASLKMEGRITTLSEPVSP